MAEAHLLGHTPIASHAFSQDAAHSLLAVARDTNVDVFLTKNTSRGFVFTPSDTLSGHDKKVTSVDISVEGKIVTCAQDRNALVWDLDDTGKWKPTLVLLRINRAATFVRWSPDGRKFAVGSGARAIAVCYFEEENDWWVSKHIKKPIRSTITTVKWHPNGVLLAGGSTDGHARVFSGFVKGVDEKPPASVWGERLPFQTLCGDYINDTGGWVHDVEFSPSGDLLAFTSHDSSVTVVYPTGEGQPPRAVVSVATSFLPFRTLIWQDEKTVIAAGHDCHPVVFQGDENGWEFAKSIDDPESKKKKSDDFVETTALNMFKQMDLKGNQSDGTGAFGAVLPTIHQNAINGIRPFEYSASGVSKFSSCGADGRIVIFDV